MIELNREFSKFSYNFEDYFHLLLEIRTDFLAGNKIPFNFNLKVEFEGFEGVLFYIYCPSQSLMKFDLLLYMINTTQYIENLKYLIEHEEPDYLDFIIVPFGQIRHENTLSVSVRAGHEVINHKMYAWAPSSLFKNVKSIIRVGNTYEELKITPYNYDYSYELGHWFKANKTHSLLNLINRLVNYEFKCDEEPDVGDIKNIIQKSNEFLFELSEESDRAVLKNIIIEIKRLRNFIDYIPKLEIANWLDDVIEYYSKKIL